MFDACITMANTVNVRFRVKVRVRAGVRVSRLAMRLEEKGPYDDITLMGGE